MTVVNNPWIVCRRTNPQAAVRLFCFPNAGGGASVFHRWPSYLPTTVEVCSLQFPGRESRINESPFTRLHSLARAISRALLLACDKPYAFYGHSVGALIGFEVARELRRNKQVLPVRLLLSGCAAPQIPDTDPPIHTLPDAEFIEKLRMFNGTPKEVLEAPELKQLFMPTLRADFALRETYVYRPEEPLGCPIAAFGGVDDPVVGQDQLKAWREHTSASFQLSMFPGDHFFLHTSMRSLMQRLSLELTQCVQNLADKMNRTSTQEVSA